MYWINHNASYIPSKQISFECDGPEDIENLPTIDTPGVQQGEDTVSYLPVNPGSTCLVIASSDVYKLNSEGNWVAL